MKKLVLRWTMCVYAWAGLGLLWAACSPAFGQTRAPRETVWRGVPDGTVAAALIPDLDRLFGHVTRNRAFLRLVPDHQAFFHAAIVRPIEERRRSSLAVPLLGEILEHVRQVRVLAILRDADAPDDGRVVPFAHDVAILAEVADPESWLSLIFEAIFPALRATHPALELGVFEFRGETVYQFADGDVRVYCALIEHTFLAASNRDILQRLVLEFHQDVLSETAQHFTAAAGHGAEADLVLVGNFRILGPALCARILARCAVADVAEPAAFAALAAADRWPVAVWQATIEADAITEHLRLWEPSPVVQASGSNRPFFSDRVVADRVLYYGVRHVNLAAIWSEFLTLQDAAPDARPIRAIVPWRAQLEAILSTPAEIFLVELGTLEIGVAWYPAEGLRRPPRAPSALANVPALLLLRADAPDLLARSLRRIFDAFDDEPARSAFQNIAMLAYRIPVFGDTSPLFYAVIDDVSVIGWSDALIKDSIRAASYGQSLAEARAYRAAAWPARSLTRGYLNLSHLARQARTLRPQSPTPRRDAASAVIDVLETLTPMTWATTVAREDVVTVARSPIGGPVIGLLVLWLSGFPVW